MRKFIIVTGGVLSGLGKGVAAASIGKLLSTYRVVPMKLDGYLNVDPGTMNPVEHGEVFVLDDGAEVDMDFGHYERFLNVLCTKDLNLTMGKVFDEIRQKERRGDFLGQTVQYVPHVVKHIQAVILEQAEKTDADIMLVEIGGTVGDIENELYIESCRQLRRDLGAENVLNVHLTYIPYLDAVGEHKSKPTQQSLALLRQRGIQPDIIICRSKRPVERSVLRKVAIFSGLPDEAVFPGLDVDSIYEVPFSYNQAGMADVLSERLKLPVRPVLAEWQSLLDEPSSTVRIAICGKYTRLEDSYASVVEALTHAAAHNDVAVELKWVETSDAIPDLSDVHGVVVPGGFGIRGIEGKIAVIKHCRENDIPFLGLCLGMQLAVIEHARMLGMDANSTEFDDSVSDPVVDLLPEQRNVQDKGATMRLGGHDVAIQPGTKAHELFGPATRLRFRHRYEVNPEYVDKLETKGLVFSGSTPDGRIKQVVERTDCRFFMATQAHPELTSKLEESSPFFKEFIASTKHLSQHAQSQTRGETNAHRI